MAAIQVKLISQKETNYMCKMDGGSLVVAQV